MPRRSIIKSAIICLALLQLIRPDALGAQPAAPLGRTLQTVAWEKLRYQATGWAVNLTATLELDVLPAAAQGSLLAADQGQPFEAAGPEIMHLALAMKVDAAFQAPVTITNDVWFDPQDARPLGRFRLRRGQDDFAKTYRFTHQGVFRRNREPRDAADAARPPHQWTDVGHNFYPYDLAQLRCTAMTDRLLLIYLASAAVGLREGRPLTVCVFGKRQLHRVTLRPDGEEKIAVDFVARRPSSETRHQGQRDALRVRLVVAPLASNLAAPENFSFLGLHRDIVIAIDPDNGLPLQVTGQIAKVASGDLKLRDVQYP